MTPPTIGGDGHADIVTDPRTLAGADTVSPDANFVWPGPLGAAAIFRESVPYTSALASAVVLVTDRPTLSAFGLIAGDRVTNIRFAAATAANGPTHQTFGFYDVSGNRLCTTVDDGATAWAANSMKSLAVSAVNKTPGSTDVLPGPWVVPYSGVFLVAITVTATVAVPNLYVVARAAGAFTAFNFDSYIPGGALAGVLPATVTLGTPGAAASSTLWAGVS